jgi:hypothetical protein
LSGKRLLWFRRYFRRLAVSAGMVLLAKADFTSDRSSSARRFLSGSQFGPTYPVGL